jgi:2-polyprenyl-3-methyl-5-hydroxy-6-metoxy-1,4-benzoquinol methylase
MKRIPSRELLDDDAGTAAEVARSLADLRLLNHYFGGVATTAYMVERIARASQKTDFTLLEVGAGSGDAVESVRNRMQKKGIGLELTLLDRCASHMAAGNGNGVNHVVGDALSLPFSNGSFDIVSCGLFVHHLTPEEVTVFANETLRCARVAVIINDLVRDPVPLAVAYAGRLIYQSRITCNDAPASVRQAYTTEEMRAMVAGNGASRVEVTRHYFYRMGAIVWKNELWRKGEARSNV